MILFDYIVNLSVFSLLVSIPLVISSFIHFKPCKNLRLTVVLYGGIVSFLLVMMSFQQGDFTYDIRYALIILVFAYFGPIPGITTGAFALLARMASGGQWLPVIIGWAIIMVSLTIVYFYSKKYPSLKKSFILFFTYLVVYLIIVFVFNIMEDNLLFHLQFGVFVFLGVVVGALLIESYVKLHRLNQRLVEMYQKVEESETKYRLIAENTSDLIMVMDKEHSFSYFSPSHENVLGYDSSEMERVKLCKFIHPEDTDMFRNTIDRMFEKPESMSIEFRLHHKQGHWMEFESRCMPVKGDNQEVEYIVIISRDISERKKAEEILLQSEKLSIVGELAAGVAHEIRNPLTTIKGFLQLYKWENSNKEISGLLLSELERIETITSEMLSLGKPQAVKLHRTNLGELLENTLEFLSPEALMSGIQFNLRIEDPGIFITCEKNQLKQVFLNILKNAIEAMPKGGTIDIHLCNSGTGECILSFQDEGVGIPEEILPRLGEPFYTLKEKGTGLGLMICNKIVKQHQGTITYHSKKQEGALVQIRLPLAV